MSGTRIYAKEVQKVIAPVRQPDQGPSLHPKQGPVQLAAQQVAYHHAQMDSNGLTPMGLLTLQRTVGNRQVQRVLAKHVDNANDEQQGETTGEDSERTAQTKLTVGTPDDVYEQEADRVARQVRVRPEHQAQAIEGVKSTQRHRTIYRASHVEQRVSKTVVQRQKYKALDLIGIDKEEWVEEVHFTYLPSKRDSGDCLHITFSDSETPEKGETRKNSTFYWYNTNTETWGGRIGNEHGVSEDTLNDWKAQAITWATEKEDEHLQKSFQSKAKRDQFNVFK